MCIYWTSRKTLSWILPFRIPLNTLPPIITCLNKLKSLHERPKRWRLSINWTVLCHEQQSPQLPLQIVQHFNHSVLRHVLLTGVLGATSWHPSTNRGAVHVHVRPAVWSYAFTSRGGVDVADPLCPAKGSGHLWMSNFHHTAHRPVCVPERCR